MYDYPSTSLKPEYKALEVMHPCMRVSVFTIPETYRKVGEDHHWVSISEDFAPAHHWHCTYGHWWCRSGIWCWYWPRVLFVKGEQTLKSIFFYQPKYFPITFRTSALNGWTKLLPFPPPQTFLLTFWTLFISFCGHHCLSRSRSQQKKERKEGTTNNGIIYLLSS